MNDTLEEKLTRFKKDLDVILANVKSGNLRIYFQIYKEKIDKIKKEMELFGSSVNEKQKNEIDTLIFMINQIIENYQYIKPRNERNETDYLLVILEVALAIILIYAIANLFPIVALPGASIGTLVLFSIVCFQLPFVIADLLSKAFNLCSIMDKDVTKSLSRNGNKKDKPKEEKSELTKSGNSLFKNPTGKLNTGSGTATKFEY